MPETMENEHLELDTRKPTGGMLAKISGGVSKAASSPKTRTAGTAFLAGVGLAAGGRLGYEAYGGVSNNVKKAGDRMRNGIDNFRENRGKKKGS